MHFAIVPFHLSKVLRLPRKSEARSYEVLHLSRKIILANLKISCSKIQPFSGNLHPDPLTHLTHVSLVLRLPRDMHLSRSSSNVELPLFLKLLQNPHVLLTFDKVQNPLCLPRKTASKRPKLLRTLSFCTFDFEMCFLPQWRALFDIWTSKSAPRPSVFNTFEVEMCFAPQQRALFRHVNFQNWSENGVLYPCWLGNALRATTACTFSTSQLLKVLRACCVFSFFTCIFHLSSGKNCSASAALASLLFDPPEPQISGKNTVFRDFPTFSRTWIFFLLTVSSLILFLLLFSSLRTVSSLILLLLLFSSLLCSSLLFSYSSHLCFSSVHIVGSLTSKLPSISWHVWVDIYEWCTWYMMFFPINHCATVPLCHGTMEQHQIWKLMKSSQLVPQGPFSHWLIHRGFHFPFNNQ